MSEQNSERKVVVMLRVELTVEPEYYENCPTPKDMVEFDMNADDGMFFTMVDKIEVVSAEYVEESPALIAAVKGEKS